MTMQKAEWEDWLDGTRKINEPMRLRDDAPEELKLKFEKWKKDQVEMKERIIKEQLAKDNK